MEERTRTSDPQVARIGTKRGVVSSHLAQAREYRGCGTYYQNICTAYGITDGCLQESFHKHLRSNTVANEYDDNRKRLTA